MFEHNCPCFSSPKWCVETAVTLYFLVGFGIIKIGNQNIESTPASVAGSLLQGAGMTFSKILENCFPASFF